MRGTQRVPLVPQRLRGIIPAHAGNTCPQAWRKAASGDHPRACGEHDVVAADDARVPGSSPRMRGTLRCRIAELLVRGIIPAHAGNTISSPPKSSLARDHPRACGEHAIFIAVVSLPVGSSPRMRGTPRVRAHRLLAGGIIPAHAGNTASMAKYGLPVRDHPRACGEHCASI